ncbi:MAG: FixH family protein [Alphaproteobacteria bacterium]|nr:FixH family protein [Alphaproteobacteria bacterium]
MQTRPKRSLIPWIFVGGMLVVVAVNAAMVATALTSFSGLAYPDAFGRGVAYNRVIADVERQERLGWTWRVSLDADAARRSESLRLDLADSAGRPLTGAQVAVSIERPVERGAPIHVELRETAQGRYVGEVALPQRGQWDVKLAIARAGDTVAGVNRIFAR